MTPNIKCNCPFGNPSIAIAANCPIHGKMREPLSVAERTLTAFALFTTAMKVGPTCFPIIEKVIDKIGIREDFEHYAKDWVEYSRRTK